MIELVTTVLMTIGSAGLFAYWFRYTCILILSAKTTQDFAAQIARANQLAFLDVQAALQSQGMPDLDRLRASLDNDYAVLARLLNQTSTDGSSIERRMLAINYRITGAWYAVSHRFSARAAQQALQDMSLVVAHFANTLGECSPSAA